METKQEQTLKSLRAIQHFLDMNAQTIPAVVNTGAKRELDEVVAQLVSYVRHQSGCRTESLGETQKQYALRHALLQNHMAPIAAIARLHADDHPTLAPFRLPRRTMSSERLAQSAYDMAQAAAPRAERFVAMGLPADFIARLTAAADAVVASVGERTDRWGQRTGATSGLKATLQHARRLVRVLDTFTRIAVSNDPTLLTNWNFVRGTLGGTQLQSAQRQLAAIPQALPAVESPLQLSVNVLFFPLHGAEDARQLPASMEVQPALRPSSL